MVPPLETYGTDCIFRIRLNLGFKCSQRVNVYLRQIVQDLQARGELPAQHKKYSIYGESSVGTFKFCIIHNWVALRKRLFRKVPFCGNSSCFRFDAGEGCRYIYDTFRSEADVAMDPEVYGTEQEYMTHAVGFDKVNFWPDNFVRSFKRSCTWPWPLNHFLVPRMKKDTRILCFHGTPTPQQAIDGFRGSKHIDGWTRPCPWVKELWEK